MHEGRGDAEGIASVDPSLFKPLSLIHSVLPDPVVPSVVLLVVENISFLPFFYKTTPPLLVMIVTAFSFCLYHPLYAYQTIPACLPAFSPVIIVVVYLST